MTAKYRADLKPATPGAVAKYPDRGGSGPRRSTYHDWLKVPPVSGFELVYVLEHVGFVLRPGFPGVASMQRQGEVVEVPLSDRLELEVLIAILHRARLTSRALMALLDAS
jgi:hypothetical protein